MAGGSRKKPPAEVPSGFVRGADIDLSDWHSGTMAVDLAGRMHCIVGYRSRNQPPDLPYYYPSAALKDKDGRASFRFVELTGGVLVSRGFLRDDEYFRVLQDRRLSLPRGSDSYFGVVETGSMREDLELTRRVFGGSQEDIEGVAIALAKLIGRKPNDYVRAPQTTFSRTRSNSCDLTGCLIPQNFPYLAFAASQYDWGHVSLYGFYRLLNFLCPRREDSPLCGPLLEIGADADALRALFHYPPAFAMPIPSRDM